MMDLFNLIIRNTTILRSAYTKNTHGAAIAAWVFYGFFGVALVVAAIGLFIHTLYVGIKDINNPPNEEDDFKEKLGLRISSVTLNSIAAFCYYYGSNINHLVDLYGGEVGCGGESGDTCVNNNKAAAAFFLAIALLLFFVTPEIIQRFRLISDKTYTTWSHIVLDVSTVIIQLNAIYSEVSIIVDTNEPCSSRDNMLNGLLITFTVLIGVGYFCFHFYYTVGTTKSSNDIFCKWAGFILSVIVCSTCCSLMYILTKNILPLGCGFKCDNLNITMIIMDKTECNLQGFSITNLVLSFSSLVFFALVFVGTICTQICYLGNAKVQIST